MLFTPGVAKPASLEDCDFTISGMIAMITIETNLAMIGLEISERTTAGCVRETLSAAELRLFSLATI